jgi:hypothetical protein
MGGFQVTNIATYKISLWVMNDEGLYEGARETIASDMREGNVWDAGMALSDYFETVMDESTVNDFAWTILSDLMGSVDWNEIAESVWGDGEEDDTEDERDECEDYCGLHIDHTGPCAVR